MSKLNFFAAAFVLFSVAVTADESKVNSNNHDSITSVVKVFAVTSRPSYYQPWQNYQQTAKTGSGCIISKNRILTNAHLVANQTFLMVRKQGDPKKYIARLIATGHECDLALLEVVDPKFYEKMPPLPLAEGFPELQDTVRVYGYPIGGDNISVTEGVVSRIETVLYSHSRRYLTAVQIDAAINPGNSGGPVIMDGKIVGVAFQGFSSGENMGYMIPATIVKHFLKDVEKNPGKSVKGFPGLNMKISKMENPYLRDWAKLKPDQTGIIITFLPPLEKAKGVFKVNDVILAIDGVKIANDATVPFRKDEVIFFGTLVWDRYIGETCKFTILRDGKVIEIKHKLTGPEELVPPRDYDLLPSYYIIGGMLFIPLTQNYLDSWSNWWDRAPRQLAMLTTSGEITKDCDQVVVLSEILADDVNIGYQNTRYKAVKMINGTKIKNLKHLVGLIDKLKDKYLVITLDNHKKIVMETEKARQATTRILRRYRIPADRSTDLR